jgi:hypothetical protein
MKASFVSLMLLYVLALEPLFSQTITLDSPNIIPPSPKTQSFNSFGNYSVSVNTGTPDINIPLYTIHSGNIEIPIVLRYLTTNLKKDGSVFSNIAHGWILDVGGHVSRCIYNKPDEVASMAELVNAKIYDQYSDNNDQQTLSQMYSFLSRDQLLDTEHDIFQYNFLGNNGSFIVDRQSDSSLKAILTPVLPYKIGQFTFYNGNTFPYIKSLMIIDDKGTKYEFGGEISEYATELVQNSIIQSTTAWYLRRIVEDTGNEIVFNYKPPIYLGSSQAYRPWYRIREQPFYPTGILYGDENIAGNTEPWDGWRGNYHASGENDNETGNRIDGDDYQILSISSIDFSEGQIIFLQNKGLITDIEVRNAQNNVLRKIHFTTSLSSTYSNLLQQMTITDINNKEVEKYDFQY